MANAFAEYTLFDYMSTLEDGTSKEKNSLSDELILDIEQKPSIEWKEKLDAYDLKKYIKDIETFGIEVTWANICNYCLTNDEFVDFLNVSKFGELYEIALAIQDKQHKKENGQYYTPEDVASVMSCWLKKLNNADIVCDVACGTGKLILTYLDLIGIDGVNRLLKDSKLYLYDLDKTALCICKTAILLIYGKQFNDNIHAIHCDFLDKNIHLPQNCKVISNPPYAGISTIPICWDRTQIQTETKELYSSFMEKIIRESNSSVIITPYSFLGSKKFYSLRSFMNNYSGFIVSFDNVPGNIFCGRKHGIFNTNTSNSVRASITVVDNKNKGFVVSPLIRFKNEERKDLLNCEVLESTLSERYQLVNKKDTAYVKCHKELLNIFDKWVETSGNNRLKNLLDPTSDKYNIYMPNTCRYFTTASSYELKRTGMITLSLSEKTYFEFVYCLINSSFVYWWWRIFDGGINYPVGLLHNLPTFIDALSEDDKSFFEKTCSEMMSIEKQCIVTKLNAGTLQENIKFPPEYRTEINNRILKILGFTDVSSEIFNVVHNNSFFGVASEEEI